MIKYNQGADTGPGYDEFPVGTMVRLTKQHRFNGAALPASNHRKGTIGEVVAAADARTFQSPHVVLRVHDERGNTRRKWFDITCLETYESGPSEQEIAAAFGLKPDAELLADVIKDSETGKVLSEAAIASLAEAIVASPVWRHA